MNNLQEFTKDEIDKYKNYMITTSKHQTPPYEWSEGIFQRFKPISGDFPIGNDFYGNMMCVNNQSGRGYYANPCGYWDNTQNQFNSGTIHNKNMNGSLFPIDSTNSFNVMSTPNNQVVFGYARIGEDIKNR